MVINGLGAVLMGQVIILTPPSFSTPSNNCTGSFTVAWGAVVNATSYILQRRVNGGAWETIYSGPNLSIAQSGLSVGSYEYQIIAMKGNKESAPAASGAVNVLAQGLISQYCSGFDLYGTYRTGCSTSNSLIQANSPSCGVVYGCKNQFGSNYNPNATHDDGSCVFPTINCGSNLGTFDENFFMNMAVGATANFTRDLPCDCCGAGSGNLVGVQLVPADATKNLVITISSKTYAGGRAYINGTIYAPSGYYNWIRNSWTGIQRTG